MSLTEFYLFVPLAFQPLRGVALISLNIFDKKICPCSQTNRHVVLTSRIAFLLWSNKKIFNVNCEKVIFFINIFYDYNLRFGNGFLINLLCGKKIQRLKDERWDKDKSVSLLDICNSLFPSLIKTDR